MRLRAEQVQGDRPRGTHLRGRGLWTLFSSCLTCRRPRWLSPFGSLVVSKRVMPVLSAPLDLALCLVLLCVCVYTHLCAEIVRHGPCS